PGSVLDRKRLPLPALSGAAPEVLDLAGRALAGGDGHEAHGCGPHGRGEACEVVARLRIGRGEGPHAQVRACPEPVL
ncbi:hypothetical protein ABE10_01535, partial [Bacillus toyonensis]|nr:hypothetical protein [Bacillus toyonensis]